MTPEEFMEKTHDYWGGYFEGWVDDLPDGAWFQVHVDAFEGEPLKVCCEMLEIKKPSGDGHDLMHAYLAATEK